MADSDRDPAFLDRAKKQGMPLNCMDHEAFAKDQQQEYSVIWKASPAR